MNGSKESMLGYEDKSSDNDGSPPTNGYGKK
jgi:hypothetical protein